MCGYCRWVRGKGSVRVENSTLRIRKAAGGMNSGNCMCGVFLLDQMYKYVNRSGLITFCGMQIL